ncbi:MAG: hypothetical protein QOK31_1950 [Solirubrobacteraceae bacterium]|jgi:hypothetical protein|nr:hypothetical protein [Solirubrobacteraceae bacterium]
MGVKGILRTGAVVAAWIAANVVALGLSSSAGFGAALALLAAAGLLAGLAIGRWPAIALGLLWIVVGLVAPIGSAEDTRATILYWATVFAAAPSMAGLALGVACRAAIRRR